MQGLVSRSFRTGYPEVVSSTRSAGQILSNPLLDPLPPP